MDSNSNDSLSPPSHWETSSREAVTQAGRQHAERQTSDSGPTSRASVAVACTGCRGRHLKCDGQKPCSRCSLESIECSYVKSRRGWKGPKKQNTSTGGLSPSASTTSAAPLLTMSPQIDTSVLDTSNIITETLAISPDGRYSLDFLGATENRGQIVLMPPPPAQLTLDASRIGLINACYTWFFPAHPFLLPRHAMLELLQKQNLNYLDLALQFIGSFYVVGANTYIIQTSLRNALRNCVGAKDAYYVQALMLFAIGLHMADQSDDSVVAMYSAIQYALGLGMHRRNYPAETGGVGTVIEECLRRTWWELYVWDGIFCGVNQTYKLQLAEVSLEMALPIDDSDYLCGHTYNVPRSIQDYDEAAFLNDEIIFSSGAYRIDAVRIIHRVLSATRSTPVNEMALDLADTHLANWALHLPDCKKKVIDREGNVDEVLFTAHMIISSCSIMLHRPRSDLSHEDVKNVTTCVNNGPMGITSNSTDMHTAKAMRAAMDICVLIKMPSPLIKHTPFFTCAIVMSAVIYLSYWSFMATQDGDHLIKEHIRLNIGSLKTLASVMPIAKTVLGQVKQVAQGLFQSRKAVSNVYWAGCTREEILQNMIEEAPHTQGPLPTTTLAGDWDVALFTNGP